MEKILCFPVILCIGGCSLSVSEMQLAEFSKTDSNADSKNQKVKNASSGSPNTWHVITPKSSDSDKKQQYNSGFDPELTDQVFKGHPAKFVTKGRVFLSKSTDYTNFLMTLL